MHKKIRAIILCFLLILSTLLAGCGSPSSDSQEKQKDGSLADGSYEVTIHLEGGSGRATVTSPAELTIKDGKMTVKVEWSSSHYDYMLVDGEKYLPVNEEGNSVFEIPVKELGVPQDVIADTTAMSAAHEIEYKMTFSIENEDADLVSEEEASSNDGGSYDLANALDPASVSKDLAYDHSLSLEYAKDFKVDYYKDGYTLVQVAGDGAFLLVPEGKEAPKDLAGDIKVLQQPLNRTYLVASAVMDMFRSIDALDMIRFSGLKAENWYLPEVTEAMEKGDILYAGKYSAPDYERIMAEGCNLVIENTMIYHTPAVKEQLERFGIPVMVDYSSYEQEPLARTEWVKLYGVLTGKEAEAEKVFKEQVAAFDEIGEQKEQGPTVAFFYFTNDGKVNVRKSSDYLPKMINMAGGTYIFDQLGSDEDTAASTISLPIEEFYAAAKDADYMIYNGTTVGQIESMADLLAQNELLAKCKAVEEKKVYCTAKNLYQSSMELGTIIGDFQKMLQGQDDKMTYLYPLK